MVHPARDIDDEEWPVGSPDAALAEEMRCRGERFVCPNLTADREFTDNNLKCLCFNELRPCAFDSVSRARGAEFPAARRSARARGHPAVPRARAASLLEPADLVDPVHGRAVAAAPRGARLGRQPRGDARGCHHRFCSQVRAESVKRGAKISYSDRIRKEMKKWVL